MSIITQCTLSRIFTCDNKKRTVVRVWLPQLANMIKIVNYEGFDFRLHHMCNVHDEITRFYKSSCDVTHVRVCKLLDENIDGLIDSQAYLKTKHYLHTTSTTQYSNIMFTPHYTNLLVLRQLNSSMKSISPSSSPVNNERRGSASVMNSSFYSVDKAQVKNFNSTNTHLRVHKHKQLYYYSNALASMHIFRNTRLIHSIQEGKELRTCNLLQFRSLSG